MHHAIRFLRELEIPEFSRMILVTMVIVAKKTKSEFLECIILLFQFEVPQKIFDDFDFFEILEAQILSGRLR